jgi:glycosyltransferase involved in cell wall biosynthesis
VSEPSVAVLMPIAPRATWLAESLASLKRQTLTNWSLLAVLDGDCEHNRSVLSESGLGTRTTIIEVPAGTGVAGALNVGLRSSDAEYVARLDADDECLPERLEHQVRAMSDRPNVWVLGSAAFLIDGKGKVIGRREVPTSIRAVRRSLMWHNTMIHPSVIMRRRQILDLGGYNTGSTRTQDYELWLRVCAVAQLENLPEPLIRYRLHPDQHSHGSRLGEPAMIRRSRRDAAHGSLGRIAADLRQAVWLSVQYLREP